MSQPAPIEYKRPPLVSTCCGCNNLRSGAIILCIFFLVFDILGIANALWNRGGYYPPLFVGITAGVQALFAIFDALGVHGISKNSLSIVRVWVYFTIVRICLATGFAVLLLFATGILIFVIYLFIVGLYIYWLVCIYSYYMDLRDRPHLYLGDVESQGLAVVASIPMVPVVQTAKEFTQPVVIAPVVALAPPPATYDVPVTDDGPVYVPPGQQQQQQQAQIPVVDDGPVYIPPGQAQGGSSKLEKDA